MSRPLTFICTLIVNVGLFAVVSIGLLLLAYSF